MKGIHWPSLRYGPAQTFLKDEGLQRNIYTYIHFHVPNTYVVFHSR